MKFTKSLALSLTVVVLLALGAIGFADKTEELQNNAPVPVTTSPANGNITDHQSRSPKYEAGEEHKMDEMPGHNMDDM